MQIRNFVGLVLAMAWCSIEIPFGENGGGSGGGSTDPFDQAEVVAAASVG